MPDRRRRSRAPRSNSLVAAAEVMLSPNRAVRKATGHDRQAWQQEAWAYYDSIGELRFGISWIANAMSRVNLVAAAPPAQTGDDPTPIDPDDPTITPSQRRAVEIVRGIADGAAGQGQLMSSFGVHLSVAGIAWLLVEPPLDDPFSDSFSRWEVLAAEEVRVVPDPQREAGVRVEVRTADREWREAHEDAILIRVWRRHPRYSWQADAPTRGVLSVLREIELLTLHIQATAQSRLAGAGVLAIPSEAVFPPGQGPQSSFDTDPDDEDTTAPEDEFIPTLIDAMTMPLTDRGNAAAVVPLVIKIPGDLVDKVKHVTFATPFDDRVTELLNNAIRRLALGLDIPPEILTGTGGMNHWGAWQVAEEAITLHVEPLSETVVHALTVGYLRPALLAEGLNPDEAVVWYDTSDLRTRPDKSKSAVEAYDRNELSGAALLREMGLSLEDAPTDEERREQILLSVVRAVPALAPTILENLGYLSADLAEEAATALESAGEAPGAPEAVSAPEAPSTPARGLPETSPAQPEAVSVQLALLAACDVIVRRALERAGSRLRSSAGKKLPGGAAAIRCSDPALLHTEIDATAFADLTTLLEGAWSYVPDIATRYGVDPGGLIESLDTYTRALLAAQQEHRYGRLATALGAS